MNRTARHELAEREFKAMAERLEPGCRVVRSNTTGPYDLSMFRPNGGHLRVTFFEIKTAQGRKASDLSPEEREFARWSEEHGSPYVIVRCKVAGTSVRSLELHRPFAPEGEETAPTAEVLP